MKLLGELWSYLWGRSSHPIYRRDLSGWSYLRAWRGVRRGCIPLMAVIVACVMGSCGLSILPLWIDSGEAFKPLLAGLYGLLVLLLSAEIVRWLTGLIATALTATAISAEIESETYALLRITLVPTREIVLAKFGAAIRQLRVPVVAVILARVTLILGAAIWAVAFVATNVDDLGLTIPDLSTIPITGLGVIAVVSMLAIGLAWLVYLVIEPLLTMLQFGAVGLFASAIARTRTNGLVAAVGLRITLGIVSYIAGQFLSSMLSLVWMPLTLSPYMPPWLESLLQRPALLVLIGCALALIYLLVLAGWQIGLMLAMLGGAMARAQRLPFG